MKDRRIWLISPICYGMVVLLFIMTALSWKHNVYLFFFELTVSILCTVFVVLTDLQ